MLLDESQIENTIMRFGQSSVKYMLTALPKDYYQSKFFRLLITIY